jgi:CRP-like cAMP-binding protein
MDKNNSTADLVDRLAALPTLTEIPREELEWLVAHGTLERAEAGQVTAFKDKRIETLWIVLSGHLSVRVDRGAGPRRVMGWRTGEVTGMLPYSRMKGPPGDNFVEEDSELLMVHESHFPEMVHLCPEFTALTVHEMLDRARRFNASDLQDEKMISLGKLAAGLAHELNNPASSTIRGAKSLLATLEESDAASAVSCVSGSSRLGPLAWPSLVAGYCRRSSALTGRARSQTGWRGMSATRPMRRALPTPR